MSLTYSNNQKTMKWEDDIIAIIKCIWWCYKANSFTRHLKNHLFCEMSLFTLHNVCVSSLLNIFKLNLDSQSRLYYSRVFWLSLSHFFYVKSKIA